MQQRAALVVEEVMRQARESLADTVVSDKRLLFEAFRRSVYAELREGLDHVGSDLRPPVQISSASATCHRLWVAERLEAAALMTLYRTQHASVVRHWTAALQEVVVDPVETCDLLIRSSAQWFAFYDRIIDLAAADVAEGMRVIAVDRRRDRWRAVRRLLDGSSTTEPCFTPYDFSRSHLSAIVSGVDADRFVAAMAARLDARKLVVPVDGSLWVWFGVAEPIGRETLERAARSFADLEVLVAYGGVREGIGGFRQSHSEAAEASAIRRKRNETTVLYGDVALETLMTGDPVRCRSFIEDELGPLVSTDKRAAILRATLSTYFASSMNATATAARIGVHDQTVAYRLRKIEELIGRPVQRRRAELEIALRLLAVEPLATDWPHGDVDA